MHATHSAYSQPPSLPTSLSLSLSLSHSLSISVCAAFSVKEVSTKKKKREREKGGEGKKNHELSFNADSWCAGPSLSHPAGDSYTEGQARIEMSLDISASP